MVYLFIYLPHKRSKNTADNIEQLERKKNRHQKAYVRQGRQFVKQPFWYIIIVCDMFSLEKAFRDLATFLLLRAGL